MLWPWFPTAYASALVLAVVAAQTPPAAVVLKIPPLPKPVRIQRRSATNAYLATVILRQGARTPISKALLADPLDFLYEAAILALLLAMAGRPAARHGGTHHAAEAAGDLALLGRVSRCAIRIGFPLAVYEGSCAKASTD